MKALVLALMVAAGCVVGGGDGGGGGGAAMPDAPAMTGSAGNACTGALYDPCTDNTQCTSANCKLFGGAGLQVCTTTCTPGDNTPCGTGTCNNMGICKPVAANSCTR